VQCLSLFLVDNTVSHDFFCENNLLLDVFLFTEEQLGLFSLFFSHLLKVKYFQLRHFVDDIEAVVGEVSDEVADEGQSLEGYASG